MAFAELDEQALKKANPVSRTNRDTELFLRVRALLDCPDEAAFDNPTVAKPCPVHMAATVV